MIAYPEFNPIKLGADIPDEARMWRNLYAVRKWCRQHTLIDEYNHEMWLASQAESSRIKMFGIWNHHECVGVCGFTSIDMLNRNAEFSLYINPKKQRKGYGKLALQTLLRHGFEDFGFERIWGETFDGNPAMNIFIDVGMEIEGTFRNAYFREGQFINSFIVSVLKDEFKIPEIPQLDIV
jgi:RimJ/RimL family protein N-acetyltransferase